MTTFADEPVAPTKTIAREPLPAVRDVNPFARTSPRGTLIADVPMGALGETPTQPAAVGATTTTPPVTATALSGTAPRPVACNERTVFEWNGPLRPLADRVSRTRDGSISKNVAPAPPEK